MIHSRENLPNRFKTVRPDYSQHCLPRIRVLTHPRNPLAKLLNRPGLHSCSSTHSAELRGLLLDALAKLFLITFHHRNYDGLGLLTTPCATDFRL